MATFTVIAFHQGGKQPSTVNPKNVRIVCDTKEKTVLAFWGTIGGNMTNVDLIENAARTKGFPFKIDCDVNPTPPPADFQNIYGHSKWVAENNRLEVL